MLTHDRSKRKAASLCHESLRYILYIIWGSLTNLKIAFFLHQRYTKLHHSKVWNIQTREMNTAFSSHNVTGFKGYLPRSPSSYPVRVVWNDNEAEIIYMLSTRGAKRGSNYIYFRFQSLSLPLSMVKQLTVTLILYHCCRVMLKNESGVKTAPKLVALQVCHAHQW